VNRRPIFILLLLLIAAGSCAQRKAAPERGDCDYYLYQDSIRDCGKRGYLIKYGYKYCKFFLETHKSRFSPAGQEWALDMGYCLLVKIHELSDSLSCKQLKKMARKSHLPCLLESGYLDLTRKDQKVYKRLGARNPLNWPAGLCYMVKLKKAAKNR